MRSAVPTLAILAVLVTFAAAETGTAPPAANDWENQNAAMGYLVLHLSSINAINGLNLTPPQAKALRDVAREVASVSAPVPRLTGPYRPDLAEVRDTYLAVRRTLLAGKEASETLRTDVGRARHTQALVARLSLADDAGTGAGCARCHREPAVPDVRLRAAVAEHTAVAPPWSRREVFLAHQLGLFGQEGTARLAMVALQVDRLLTDGQKEALRNFACCLLPPKDLADPVRIGQADGGETAVKILRYARSVSVDRWPAVKDRLLDRTDRLLVLLKPGATDARKQQVRQQAAAIFEEARARSDVDFELDKNDLARRLTGTTKTPQALTDRQLVFTRAMFLMVPGAADAYDALLGRLAAAEEPVARAGR